jgi:hypothetical protein
MSMGSGSLRGSKLPWDTDPRAGWSVKVRVLVYLAELQAPALDVVDVAERAGLLVRDLLVHFRDAEPPVSPATVRAALHDLRDGKQVEACGLDRSGEFMQGNSEVRLTCRGLVAAREVDPGCGLPRRALTLRTLRGKPMLDARFDTGTKEWDDDLNSTGTVLAAAFIVLVEKPTRDKPLVVEKCHPYIERLTMFGVRNRPGPKSDEVASEKAIRDAFDKLGKLLNLTRGFFDEDKRRDYYFLSGPLPEIRIEAGDRRHYGDWGSYSYPLWHIMREDVAADAGGRPTTRGSLGGIPDIMDHLFPPAADVGQVSRRSERGGRKAKVKKAKLLLPESKPSKPKLGEGAAGSSD